MTKRRAALLERHGVNMTDWTHPDRYPKDRYKIVLLPHGQTEDFDEDGATRKWLWPHLGRAYHLVDFIDAVELS